MGFQLARKHAAKLATIAYMFGFWVPAVLLIASVSLFAEALAGSVLLTTLGLVAVMAGIVTERWLFFAEAKHAVMNYYGG